MAGLGRQVLTAEWLVFAEFEAGPRPFALPPTTALQSCVFMERCGVVVRRPRPKGERSARLHVNARLVKNARPCARATLFMLRRPWPRARALLLLLLLLLLLSIIAPPPHQCPGL